MLTKKIIALRFPIILLSLLAMAAGVYGCLQLQFDSDTRVFFGKETQERLDLVALEERHGRAGAGVLMLEVRNGDVFDEDVLETLRDVAERIGDIDDVADIASLATREIFPVLEEGQQQPVPKALVDGIEITDERIEALETFVDENEYDTQIFISKDRSIIVTNIIIDELNSNREIPDIIADIEAEIDEIEEDYSQYNFYLSGSAALRATFLQAVKADIATLTPAQCGVLFVILIITLASFPATAILFFILTVMTAITMGVGGIMGITLNGVTASVPTILLGLVVATCVHIIMAWQDRYATSGDNEEALTYALTINFKPVALAIATTIASFLALNFSDSQPFREQGNLCAFGLAVSFLLCYTLLPALLSFLTPKPSKFRELLQSWMTVLGRAVIRLQYPIIIVFVIMTGLSGYALTKLVFDDNFAEYFDDRFEFREATDLLKEKVTGVSAISYSIPSTDEGDVYRIDNLKRMDEFVEWLKNDDRISHVTSYLDYLRGVRQGQPQLFDEDGFPVDNDVAEKLANDYLDANEDSVTRFLDEELEYGLVNATMSDASSIVILAFAEDGDEKVIEIWGDDVSRATGDALLAAHLSERNTKAMIQGTGVALVIISGIMIFALGGVGLGLVSLIPNLVPLLLAYGFWAFVFVDISFAGTVVVAMTFGMVVDGTVHLLTKFQYMVKVRRMHPNDALIECFQTVGLAVLITAVAIGSGFAVMATSGFIVNHHLGLLTLITLFAAMLADLLFLPALLAPKSITRTVGGTYPKFVLRPLDAGGGGEILLDGSSIASAGQLRIGRDPNLVNHQLQNPTVSGTHADVLYSRQDGLMIRDCGSTNGTFINRSRVYPWEENGLKIVPGDVISLGKLSFRVDDANVTGVSGGAPPVEVRDVNWLMLGRNSQNRLLKFRLAIPENLPEADFVLGRSSSLSNIALNEESISRQHAVLYYRMGDGFAVEDLGSTNGTFVNGHRVSGQRIRVNSGDELRLGDVTFTVSRET